MTLRRHAFTGLIVFFLPCASAIAQSSDPFGSTPPAGTKATGDAAADPFGSDPFGGGQTQDRKASRDMDDPFGGSSKAVPARKANATKPPALVHAKARPKPASPEQAEARIQAALSDETSMTFVNTPLEEAAQMIGRTHKIPVVVDRLALEAIGVSVDAPVNLDLKNVSLRSFLRLMLRELDMTYVIDSEVLIFTTTEASAHYMTLATYSFYDGLSEQSESIVRALTSSVEPDAWSTKGGRCSISVVENVLFVLANASVHDDVADFMKKLHVAFADRYGE